MNDPRPHLDRLGTSDYSGSAAIRVPAIKNRPARTALVLAVVSWFCLGPLLGLPAIFLAVRGLLVARELGGRGRAMAVAAIVVAVIGSVNFVVTIVNALADSAGTL
jgi:hypothetical protein